MLTQKRLKELLSYDHNTGLFTKLKSSGGVKSGSIVGYKNKRGYIEIGVDYKLYHAQRLAFLYVNGYLPEHGVDHNDRNTSNNRWNNLSEATQVCNGQNCNISKNNTSGFPGVTYSKKQNIFIAQATLNRKCIYIGSFDSSIEAALARLTWELNTPEWKCNHDSVLVAKIKQTGLKIII